MPHQPEMPAVILAAGTGFRLNAGKASPKCLTPVLGRPLLAWIAEALAAGGVDTIHLMLGNEAEQVEKAVKRLGVRVDIRTSRCPDWQLGNGRSAAHAENVLGDSDRFVLVMSDHLITAAHVLAVTRAEIASDGQCLLATCETEGRTLDLDDATKVLVDAAGRILQISKTLEDFNAIDTGVFRMSRALFPALARAHAAGDHSLSGGNRDLVSRGLLFARPIGDLLWQDVDTPADLRAAEQLAMGFSRPM